MPLAISSGSVARRKGMALAKMAMFSGEANPVSVKPGTTILIRMPWLGGVFCSIHWPWLLGLPWKCRKPRADRRRRTWTTH
eukprot:scaffold61399_cov59-Attheya_sp.AAC.3